MRKFTKSKILVGSVIKILRTPDLRTISDKKSKALLKKCIGNTYIVREILKKNLIGINVDENGLDVDSWCKYTLFFDTDMVEKVGTASKIVKNT